jgi:hypothetical protein
MKCKILLSALALIFSVSLCAYAGETAKQPPTYDGVVMADMVQQPVIAVPGEYMISATYDVAQGVDFVLPVSQVTLRDYSKAETFNSALSGFADTYGEFTAFFTQAHQRFRHTNNLITSNRRCSLQISQRLYNLTNRQLYAPDNRRRWVTAQRK